VGETGFEPAPKEQPPRKLSGTRDRGGQATLEREWLDHSADGEIHADEALEHLSGKPDSGGTSRPPATLGALFVSTLRPTLSELEHAEEFIGRHIGPGADDALSMLEAVGSPSIDALVAETVPASIRLAGPLALAPPATETEVLARLRTIASRNEVFTSLIGLGYHDTITPPVILRNVIENPAWYTAYTPYQPEISQGRLEALLTFQTMIADLTGLPLANASLLDEGTAAAEAMTMLQRICASDRTAFFVDADCHPQTIAVVLMSSLGIPNRISTSQASLGRSSPIRGRVGAFATCAGSSLAFMHTAGVWPLSATRLPSCS
jgi:hypothetical protein